MASNYPAGFDALPNVPLGANQDEPDHRLQHNNVNDAARALQQTLGKNPQGAHPTVADRLGATVPGFSRPDGAMHVGEFDPMDPPPNPAGALSIGLDAVAEASGAVALGPGSVADTNDAVAVGHHGHTRRIIHVTEGEAPSDAATISQLPTQPSDIGAMPLPVSPSEGDTLVYENGAWVAAQPQGGGSELQDTGWINLPVHPDILAIATSAISGPPSVHIRRIGEWVFLEYDFLFVPPPTTGPRLESRPLLESSVPTGFAPILNSAGRRTAGLAEGARVQAVAGGDYVKQNRPIEDPLNKGNLYIPPGWDEDEEGPIGTVEMLVVAAGGYLLPAPVCYPTADPFPDIT